MATLTLPTTDEAEAFTFEVSLEGTLYLFALAWNARDSAWYMAISDADGAPIATGIRVVVDWPLLKGVADSRRPPGEIFALDTTGTGDPGLADLGGRVSLIYNESE